MNIVAHIGSDRNAWCISYFWVFPLLPYGWLSKFEIFIHVCYTNKNTFKEENCWGISNVQLHL